MKQRLRALLAASLLVPVLAACQTGGGGSARTHPTATRGAAKSASIPQAQPTSPTVTMRASATSTAASVSTRTARPSATPANSGTSKTSTSGNGIPTSAQGGTMAVPKVVQMVRPGVVQVISQFGQNVATGSGFFFDNKGHILTNNHVVAGASRITVVTANNRILRATLVGRDELTDVAVLKVSAKVPPLKLGNSDKLQVGEPVVAIGSALALPGGPTVTTGVVSALERVQQEPGQTPQQAGPVLYGLIQTDAAVNPGNSGGPLLDLRGEVIGINTLGQRSTQTGESVQGINFAVSINTARSVADEIIRTGHVVYPFLGIVAPQYLYPQVAVEHNIPYTPGEYVTDVVPGGPADRAGLRPGDIIVAINGKKLDNESSFVRILRSFKPGQTITLTIQRNGQKKQIKVTLARRPPNA